MLKSEITFFSTQYSNVPSFHYSMYSSHLTFEFWHFDFLYFDDLSLYLLSEM